MKRSMLAFIALALFLLSAGCASSPIVHHEAAGSRYNYAAAPLDMPSVERLYMLPPCNASRKGFWYTVGGESVWVCKPTAKGLAWTSIATAAEVAAQKPGS